MLTVDQTTRSYSGKPGCMCGCNGEYKDSQRARKLAITQLLKNPSVRFHSWNDGEEGCVFVTTASRNRVLYLTAEGVRTALAMGMKPD
jgi:hypothetical protein